MNTATHLTLAERYQIEIMRRYATGHNKIARSLGRSRSTIDREVERNLSPNGRYNAVQANAFARARLRSRARANARHIDPAIWARVHHDLAQHYTPEQISGRLRLDGGELRTSRSMPISTPTSVPVVICGANFPVKSCANGATARAGPAAT